MNYLTRKEEADLASQVTLMQRRQIPMIHETTFRNISERELTMDDVFARIRSFMLVDPRAAYQLMVGTDAQVHAGHTKFVTSVVVFRPGRGAWFCYRQIILPREIRSLQEKLSLETTFSQETASYFDESKRAELEDILLPYVYQGSELKLFIDIDAGTDAKRNRTSTLVAELVGRIEAMGLSARVKPEAIAASSISNRYTKTPYREKKSAVT